MPLYVIDTIAETGVGPFTEKSQVIEAFDEENDSDVLVVEIDENGVVNFVKDVRDYLEDDAEE